MSHPDLEKLLNVLLGFARDQLSKHGDFSPFGAAVTRDGQTNLKAAYEGDEGTTQGHIDLLEEGLRAEAQAGVNVACGICVDVRVKPPSHESFIDAVQVHLEHRNGESVDVFLPYERTTAGDFSYGTLFATKAEPQVFQRS